MRKKYTSIHLLLLVLMLSPWLALAQSFKKVTIEVSSNKYTPQDVSINVGDTVEFKFVGGTHPTISDDNLWSPFTLSSNSPSKKLSSEFTAAGQYTFYCQNHANPDSYPAGMTGKITVAAPSTGVPSRSLAASLNIYPNPVQNQINIQYYLKRDGLVSIRILDVLGKEVANLLSAEREAGNQEEELNISGKIPGGMYFIKISAGTETIMKRISVM